MTIKIYHNPRCSKSREALKLIRSQGLEPELVEYLKNTPSMAEIYDLLAKLGKSPRDIMRKGEAIYTELGLSDTAISDEVLIEAMVDNPILIERPIVVNGDKAALGRPPEDVLKVL